MKIIVKVAKNDFDFIGIESNNQNLIMIFPIGYDIEERELETEKLNKEESANMYENFKILISLLDKTEGDSYDKGELRFAFSVAEKIMEDYMQNGLYQKDKFKETINGNGKIDWKKTINVVEPIVWKNAMIFDKRYTIQSVYGDDIITKIHKKCIYIILKIFGWIYLIDKDDFKVDDNLDNDEMIYELEKELYKTNQDNKKELLSNLILFINGTNIVEISSNKEFKIGRTHFDKEWEKLLRKRLYTIYQRYDKVYPKTYYEFENGNIQENSSLIPDIVFKKKNTIIIVDAKYYKSGYLPESSDVSKQLFYGEYVKKNNPKCTVYNMFILPKNVVNNLYEKIGFALAKGWDIKKKIDLFYLDTKSLMQSITSIQELIEKNYFLNDQL